MDSETQCNSEFFSSKMPVVKLLMNDLTVNTAQENPDKSSEGKGILCLWWHVGHLKQN